MRGRGGGSGCKPGNSNAMIRAPLPAHPPKSRQRRASRGAGEVGWGVKGSHPERVRPPRDPEGRRELGSAGSPARAREAGAVALGRAAAGAWH